MNLDSRKWFWSVCTLLLTVAAGLRFWNLADRPGTEWDEPVYTSVGASQALHGVIQAKTEFGVTPEPYLYHPPFYFKLLGGWFQVFGTGITQARYLAAIASLVMLVALAGFLRGLIGKWALLAVAFVAFDNWVIFTNRVSWLENTMMPLAIAALWFYATAMKRPAWWRFIGAGIALGAVVSFKHIGAFFIGAIIINWLIQRRHHAKHLALLAAAIGTMASYVGGMLLVYGHDYIRESDIQFNRTSGTRESRGALTNLSDIIVPLSNQYRVFWVTIGLMAIGAFLIGRVLIRTLRTKSLEFLRNKSLLFSWAVSGVVFFSVMQLKLPHYFMLAVIPVYAYIAAEVKEWYETRRGVHRRAVHRGLAIALVLFVGLNLTSFWFRIVERQDNALRNVAAWTATHLAPGDRVITEESVGTIIEQPYCKMWRAAECSDTKNPKGGANYLITYTSTTQHPPDTPAINAMLDTWVKQAEFHGFKETITVYKRPASADLR